MKYVNWFFLEAGHGEGAADGVGGILKRTADRLVANGRHWVYCTGSRD